MNSIGLTNVRKPGKSIREVMSSREKPSTRVRSRSRDLTAAKSGGSRSTLRPESITYSTRRICLQTQSWRSKSLQEFRRAAKGQFLIAMMIRIRATRHDTLAWIGDIGESVEQREDPHRGCLLRRLAAPYPYPEKWNRSEWQRHMRLAGMGLSICRSII